MSLFAGTLGASLMVTSSENIGISRLTGVRSRFVTAAAGGVLVAVGLLSPLSRAVAGLPPAVVGESALVVYAVIAVMGVQMLARSELAERGHSMIAALALAVGLLPIVAPTLYDGFPGWIRTLLGSGVVAGTLTAVLLHALFTVTDRSPRTGAGQRQSGKQPPLTTPDQPRSADRAPAPPEG
ncbi:solute carrier family 23 protein [Streptomyces sp. 1268]|uniref:solute carrier family 23 protein n=1 Tax=Streptomyces sp. 1268 TaxID=3231942 RepID=UPI0038D3800A